MDTKIEYLQHLERDLKTAASEELRQERRPTTERKRRGRWLPIAAVIVSLLLLAGIVGFFSSHSLSPASSTAAGGAIAGPADRKLAFSGRDASDSEQTALTGKADTGGAPGQYATGNAVAGASPGPATPQC